MALLRLVADDHYLLAHPHEATIYASNTSEDADQAGFDRWLSAATDGELSNLPDLLRSEHAASLSDYLRAYAFGHPSPAEARGDGLSFRLVDGRPELSARLPRTAADLRWQVQSADDAQAWSDVSATFAGEFSEEGLTLLGPPRRNGEATKLYRLNFSLEGGSQLAPGLTALANTSRYGITGAAWQSDPATGHLVSASGAPGAPSRLLVEVDAPTLLDFTMSVHDGDGSDRLAFSIDGELVAETTGESVAVERTITPTQPVLLMWEFRGNGGTALIAAQRSDPLPLPAGD